MNGTQTTSDIEAQITRLELLLVNEPEKQLDCGKLKYNRRHFSLKGKIANLRQQLAESKNNDWLAR